MSANKPITVPNKAANTCKVCHARELCLSSCLNEDELNRFDDIIGDRASLNRGECLFMAGNKIKSLFILHSGSVKTYVESADGDMQITGFHFSGDIIGIHGIENSMHGDTVEALETSSVCELRFTSLDEITTVFPKLQDQLMQYIFREMCHEQTMMLVLGKMSADRRLAHFILDISARLSEHGLSATNINLTMTRHDIANYLGLAVETVSRLLTRFQKMGIITVQRRLLTIFDIDALQDIYDQNESHIPKASIGKLNAANHMRL